MLIKYRKTEEEWSALRKGPYDTGLAAATALAKFLGRVEGSWQADLD